MCNNLTTFFYLISDASEFASSRFFQVQLVPCLIDATRVQAACLMIVVRSTHKNIHVPVHVEVTNCQSHRILGKL